MTSIAESLATGLRHHRAGDLQRAQAIYLEILQADPAHADALHFLGLIARQVGKPEMAVDYMKKSLTLKPHNAGFHYNLGTAYQELKDLDRAAASFREAVRIKADYADAHFSLAATLKMQGQLDAAADQYRQTLSLRPGDALAHNNLGNILWSQNKPEEALAHYREAVRLDPRHALAHNNLANLLLAQGQPAAALPHLRQAGQTPRKLAECHALIAAGLHARGDADGAIGHLREALVLRPDYVDAHNNLGNALRMQGTWEEAAACYQQALRLRPDCAEAMYNLGGIFAEHKQVDQAESCFRQAWLTPEMPEAHLGLGQLLADQIGKVDEAIVCLKEALRLQPSDWLRIELATRLPVVYQSNDDIQFWRDRLIREVNLLRQQHVVVDLTNEEVVSTFYLAYQGLIDRDIQRQIAGLYRVAERILPRKRTQGKIRVGLISSFFMDQTIGHWMKGLAAQLSRDDFSLTVLSIGNHDDNVARFFKQQADTYVVLPRHLPTARALIAGQNLDILLYADIGMHPFTSTLAFSRLATLQCVTLGHPETTGIGTIDYFLSTEDLETDMAQDYYTETLVKLKTLPIHYYRPTLPNPLKDRTHFGLKADDHVYVCLQSLFKFHPDFDELLGGILRGDPRGVLLLTRWLVPHAEQLCGSVSRSRSLTCLTASDFSRC